MIRNSINDITDNEKVSRDQMTLHYYIQKNRKDNQEDFRDG